MTNQEPDYYWSIPTADLFRQFDNTITEKARRRQQQEVGLTSTEANLRLLKYGKNMVESKKKTDSLSLLISQFKSPIIVIFIFTSILSFFLGQVAILLSTPLAGLFGFTSLSMLYFYAIGIILLIYVVTAEIVKKIFYKRIEF